MTKNIQYIILLSIAAVFIMGAVATGFYYESSFGVRTTYAGPGDSGGTSDSDSDDDDSDDDDPGGFGDSPDDDPDDDDPGGFGDSPDSSGGGIGGGFDDSAEDFGDYSDTDTEAPGLGDMDQEVADSMEPCDNPGFSEPGDDNDTGTIDGGVGTPPPPLQPLPTTDIRANNSNGPITIGYGTAATLEWCGNSAATCANATSCSVPGIGSGTSKRISTGNLTTSKTYTLTCTGPGGSRTDSVRVNVGLPPPPLPSLDGNGGGAVTINNGGGVTLEWSASAATSCSGVNFSTSGPPGTSGSVVVTPTVTTMYTLVCNYSSNYSPTTAQSSVEVTVLDPDLSIDAIPTQVRPGNITLIEWSAVNVDSCTVTGPNFSASGTSGGQTSGPITQQSTYTLICINAGGQVSDSVTIFLIPAFEEF